MWVCEPVAETWCSCILDGFVRAWGVCYFLWKFWFCAMGFDNVVFNLIQYASWGTLSGIHGYLWWWVFLLMSELVMDSWILNFYWRLYCSVFLSETILGLLFRWFFFGLCLLLLFFGIHILCSCLCDQMIEAIIIYLVGLVDIIWKG